MKMILKMAGVVLAGGLALGGFNNARAELEIGASVQIHARDDFEGPLAAHGSWIDVRSRGRCWRPGGIAAGWRPYCDGQWVWTDAGWYWDSDEPWAWACYHYGTWYDDPDNGWIWVPGVQWAPAWVEWRSGGGYIGWAPCAPSGVVIAPASFAFVGVDRFNVRVRPGALVVNDPTIYRKTSRLASAKSESREIGGARQRVVYNAGPGVAMIQKATGRSVAVVPIERASRRTTAVAAASIRARPTTPALQRGPVEVPVPRAPLPDRRAVPESVPASPARPIPPERRPENVIPNEHGVPAPQAPGKVVPARPTPVPPPKPPEPPEKPHDKDRP